MTYDEMYEQIMIDIERKIDKLIDEKICKILFNISDGKND